MNLGLMIAAEVKVKPDQVMLLRHSNRSVTALEGFGASIEEYTVVQPTNSKYDFLADGRVPIRVVVAIVYDRVYAVYRITGVERSGTTRTLTSPAFCRFDIAQGYDECEAKRFSYEVLESRSIGRLVSGWTSPRCPVARYGGRLFNTVRVQRA